MTFKTHLYTNPHFPIASPGSVAILFRGIPFEYSNDVVIAHFAFVFFCWFSMNVMPPTFMPNTEKDGSCCRSSEPRVLFMSNFSNAGRYMKIPSHTHTQCFPPPKWNYGEMHDSWFHRQNGIFVKWCQIEIVRNLIEASDALNGMTSKWDGTMKHCNNNNTNSNNKSILVWCMLAIPCTLCERVK